MVSDSYSQLVWRTYAAVRETEFTEKEYILYAEGGGRNIRGELEEWMCKPQKVHHSYR